MLQTLLDWLLPRQCYLCSRYTSKHVCVTCLDVIVQKNIYEEGIPPLNFFSAYFEYSGAFQKLMHGLKFQKMKPIASLLADSLRLPKGLEKTDYWVPVVPHKSRLKGRGFNPVDLIFETLVTQNGGIYLKHGLERIKETPFLHTLSAQERLVVLDQAFLWKGPDLRGKSVVILDDIFTTGATISTIASMLKQEGAHRVSALTLSYVVLKGRKSE